MTIHLLYINQHALTDAELNLAKNYAATHYISLEDAFKQALFDKIKDEYYVTTDTTKK